MMHVPTDLKHRITGPLGPSGYRSKRGQKPLFCLHGFGGSAQDFEGISPHIHSAFELIALNLPGHGGLGLADDPFSQILDSIHALSTQPIALLGYSMGGRIALKLAQSGVLNIDQLILIGTTPGIASPAEQLSRRAFEDEVDHRLATNTPAEFETWWRTLPPIQTQASMPDRFQSKMHHRRCLNDLERLRNAQAVFGTSQMSPMWSGLTSLTMPTVLITGEADEKYAQIAREMSTQLPRSTHIQVSQCGHAPHLERPSQTAGRLNPYLARAD